MHAQLKLDVATAVITAAATLAADIAISVVADMQIAAITAVVTLRRTVACAAVASPCAPATVSRQVWVPKMVTKDVTCTVNKIVTEQVPYEYTVCTLVPEKRTSTVKAAKCVPSTQTRDVKYTVCEPQQKTYTVKVAKCVQEPATRDVTYCELVPQQRTYTVKGSEVHTSNSDPRREVHGLRTTAKDLHSQSSQVRFKNQQLAMSLTANWLPSKNS